MVNTLISFTWHSTQHSTPLFKYPFTFQILRWGCRPPGSSSTISRWFSARTWPGIAFSLMSEDRGTRGRNGGINSRSVISSPIMQLLSPIGDSPLHCQEEYPPCDQEILFRIHCFSDVLMVLFLAAASEWAFFSSSKIDRSFFRQVRPHLVWGLKYKQDGWKSKPLQRDHQITLV